MSDQGATAVEAFLRAWPGHDARSAVREEVSGLLRASGQFSAPTNLFRIARYCNVARISRRELAVDAEIRRCGGSYEIVLNSLTSRRRQRFSLAHELAHTFFLKHNPAALIKQRTVSMKDRRALQVEERLCNFAAAEMLMPEVLFRQAADDAGPSLDAAVCLSNGWDVSLEACCARICELTIWPASFLWLRLRDQTYKVTGAAGMGRALRRSEYTLNGRLGQIAQNHRSWSGRLELQLGGPAERYFCEVRSVDRRSVGVMILHTDEPEQLLKRSRLKVWSKLHPFTRR